MPLLIATHNPAKLRRYRNLLAHFPTIEVLSPGDVRLALTVAETGATAAENARIKAEAYANAAGLPALGIDEALFIPALSAGEQPGVLVRRNGGRTLSDEELLETFLEKARRLAPEQRGVRWVYSLCLSLPGGKGSYGAETGWAGWLTDQPELPYSPGYPLSAILLDGNTRKPVRLLTEAEQRQREAPLATALTMLVRLAGLD